METPAGTSQLLYDAAGNLVLDESGLVYEYDHENRLVRVSCGAQEHARYTYDALGRKVEAVVEGVTTRYYYDGQNVIVETDGNDAVRRYFVNGPLDASALGASSIDERVLVHDASTDGELYYLLQELYTVAGLANTNGVLVEAYTYDSYGRVTAPTADNPYYFTGRSLDVVCDKPLYDYRARHYDPIHGRFLQRDRGATFLLNAAPSQTQEPEPPSVSFHVSLDLQVHEQGKTPLPANGGYEQLMNPYLYALNAPTGHVDPDGREAEKLPPGSEEMPPDKPFPPEAELVIPVKNLMQKFPCGKVTVTEFKSCSGASGFQYKNLSLFGDGCKAFRGDPCNHLPEIPEGGYTKERKCPGLQQCCGHHELNGTYRIVVPFDLKFPLLCRVSGTFSVTIKAHGWVGGCN